MGPGGSGSGDDRRLRAHRRARGERYRARRGPVTARQRWQMVEGYLFASPWIIGFGTFTAGAMLYSVWMSFQRWNILTPPQFVGGLNYQKAFCRDPLFWKCLANTAYYSSVSVPLRLLI